MSLGRLLRASARVGLIGAAGMAVACGGEDKSVVETEEGGVIVDIDEGNPSGQPIRAEIPPEGALPSDFPADIPRYPGSTPKNSMSVAGQGTIVIFESTAGGEEVIDFFTNSFGEGGWTVESAGRGNSLSASKGARSVNLFVTGKDGGSEIAMHISDV